MNRNTGWNWSKVDDTFWIIPSEDIYFLLHRWKERNFTDILDLGCGKGRHSLLFAENDYKVTGFDLADNGLNVLSQEAKKKNLNITTIKGDVVDLPFEDDGFDGIIAYHSIYHVNSEGMKNVIDEIYRILKPGGEIYVTLISKNTYSFTSKECKTIDTNVRFKEEQEGTFLPHYFVDFEDIKVLFKDFQIIKARQIEDLYDGKSSWHYFLLLGKGKNEN